MKVIVFISLYVAILVSTTHAGNACIRTETVPNESQTLREICTNEDYYRCANADRKCAFVKRVVSGKPVESCECFDPNTGTACEKIRPQQEQKLYEIHDWYDICSDFNYFQCNPYYYRRCVFEEVKDDSGTLTKYIVCAILTVAVVVKNNFTLFI